MATIDVLLNNLDEVIENSMNLPLSGGRCIVDAVRIRELIDDIRLQMPNEIKQAKAVVADRNEILSMAKREAEGLIRKAEERAKALVEQDTIVRQANSKALAMLNEANQKASDILGQTVAKANELTAQTTAKATESLTQTTIRSREMKQAAYDFSESSLRSAEEALANALSEVRNTRQALRAGSPGQANLQQTQPR
ncbi:MAG: ATPase [Angelakisella sp.]